MLLAASDPKSRDEHIMMFMHVGAALEVALDEYFAITGNADDCLRDEAGSIRDYREHVLAEWAALIAGGEGYSGKDADEHLEPWKEMMRTVAMCAAHLGSSQTFAAEKGVIDLARDLRRDQAVAIGAGLLSFVLLSFGIITVIVPTARRAKRLADVARMLSDGNRSVDCGVGGNDEIGDAGRALDRMRVLMGQRESELVRRVTEARELAAALERSPLTTFITDGAGAVVWSSRAAGDAKGMSLQSMLRNARYDERQVRAAQAALAGGEPFTCERTLLNAEGGRCWFNLDAYPIRDERGQLSNYVVIERDVSMARRAELNREGNARVMAMLVGATPLSVVLGAFARHLEETMPGILISVMTLEGDRLRQSAAPTLPVAFAKLVDGIQIGPDVGSCGRAAFVGEEVVVADVATHPYWARYRGIADAFGIRACWSFPCRAPDGEILGTLAAYLRTPREPSASERQMLQMGTNFASLALARQRADQRNALRSLELSEARAELERIRRETGAASAARSELIASALRDLRGAVASAARRANPQRALDETLQSAEDIGWSLMRDDRRPSGTRMWRVPGATVRDAIAGLADAAAVASVDIRLDLVTEGESALPELALCDHERLRRTLTHLVSTAIERAGRMRIAVRMDCGWHEHQGTLRVVMRDGCTADLEAGCALARIVAERDGGVVRVHREGEMRVVVLTVPCVTLGRGAAGDAMEPVTPIDAGESSPHLSGRVLVVDDHGDNRTLFTTHLRQVGLAVEEASNGTDAMAAILNRAGMPPLDLVLLDMQLPGIDGYGVARGVRAAGLGVPIIATTAHGMQGERERCLAAGCDEVALKPIARNELLGIVARVLRRGSSEREIAAVLPVA